MPITWPLKFLRSGSTAPAAAPQATAAAVPASSLRYPPADSGLPVLSAQAILNANEDLIGRLRTHAAVADRQFDTRFLQPLFRLAELVNVLPATSAGLFSGEMGLFRAALESGFYSFQASDGRIFTGAEGVEKRHALEGRWRYLCFLAGLIYPIGRTLEQVVVTDGAGRTWLRHYMGLTEWAASNGIARLFVSWPTASAEDAVGPSNAGLVALPKVAGAENLQHLQDGSADLVAALYQLALGNAGEARIAHQVVTGTWQKIERREAARRPQAFGKVVAGTHLGPYIAGAVRALVENGTWKPNESHLKADREGVYLAWPDAAEALIEYGRRQGYPGWPADAPTLAAVMTAAQIVEPRTSDLGLLEIVDSQGEIYKALKFANPLAVLEDFDPDSYAVPRTVDALLRADPLAQAEAKAAAQQQSAAPAQAQAATAAEKPAIQAVEEAASPAPPAEQAGSPAPTAAVAEAQPLVSPPGPKIVEAAPVSYADLVPEDVRKTIHNALHAELLGKVIKLWRDRPAQNSPHMRRVEQGAAVALEALAQIIRDIPSWADSMAEAGLLYSPLATPGLKVQDVAIPEGKKKVKAIILSNLACKKLGL